MCFLCLLIANSSKPDDPELNPIPVKSLKLDSHQDKFLLEV